MAKVVNIGDDVLTDTQTKAFDKLSDDVPSLKIVFVMSNAEKVSHENLLPSGTVLVMSSDTPVDSSLLPENMFSILASYDIVTEEKEVLTDRHFETIFEEGVCDKINEKMGTGPSKNNMILEGLPAHIGCDKRNWAPSLGKGFWSISKCLINKFDPEYKIVVYVPNTQMGKEFEDHVTELTESHNGGSAKTSTEFKELLNSQNYHLTKNSSRRNADKIATIVADAFGVNVKSRIDTVALYNLATNSRPEIAIPSAVTYYNHLDGMKLQMRTETGSEYSDCTAIYNKAGSIRNSVNAILVPVDPLHGVLAFENPVSGGNITRNKFADAVPFGLTSPTPVTKLTEGQKRFIRDNISWPTKAENPVIPEEYFVSRQHQANTANIFEKYIKSENLKVSLYTPVVSFLGKL